MPKLQRHVFVCINHREPDHPRGCCASKAGFAVAEALKLACADRGLKGKVRVNKSQCLDQCEHGPTVVVYPEQVWYGFVKPEDVDEIVEEHLIGGQAVQRLVLSDACINTDHCPHRSSGMMQLGM